MADFLLNLLKTTLLGGLVIVALLATKPLWNERYRAKTRCALWLALAIFLLLPIDFSVQDAPLQLSVPQDYTLFVGGEKTTIMKTDTLFAGLTETGGQTGAVLRDEWIQKRGETISAAGTLSDAAKAQRYIPVATLLFAAYLTGLAGFLAVQGISFLRFRRTVRRWSREVTRSDYRALLEDTAHTLAVKPPRMVICPAVTTPAVTGLFRPTLLLPHEDYAQAELRFILRHELCHLKRHDMLFKVILLMANAMHWFDPLVYLMLRQADEDIELACDSAATKDLGREERAAYSRTLLAAVQSRCRTVPATTCFGGTVERLKRRITNVLGAQKKRGLGMLALVLAMTLAAGCATSWGGTQDGTPDGTDTGARYERLEDYFDELMAELNAGTVHYYVEESADYPDGVSDEVADARMIDASQCGKLEGLAPDGAALELWSYRYEQKPANEKDLTIMLVGGQTLSDDGYLDDGFTRYLVVLHRTDGEGAGYEIIGFDRSNDGLWYDGVGYGDEYAAYLHDYYVDYEGLHVPKLYIGDLLGGTAADGYGREDFVAAKLITGDGCYFYAPLYGWENNAGTQYWHSGYYTGSSFNVHLRGQNIMDAAAEWSATGAEKTERDTGCTFVTNKGMSNTVIWLVDAPDDQHYEITLHWEYDGSADNEWGWNHDRAAEQEAAILAAMANSFRVSKETEYVPGFTRDLDLASSENGAAALALWEKEDGKELVVPRQYPVDGTGNGIRLNACTYVLAEAADVPEDGARVTLWLKNNDASWFTFYEGTNLVSYHVGLNDPVEYYEAQEDFSIVDGDGRTIFNEVRGWYDEAELLALRNELPQIAGDTWEAAAQNWAEEFFGLYTRTTSGSRYCYSWCETTIEPAENTTVSLREAGDIGENEYCFYTTTRFVLENEEALLYAIAGNSTECADPDAPEGAWEYHRCCTIKLGDDGLWHGTMWGTGW